MPDAILVPINDLVFLQQQVPTTLHVHHSCIQQAIDAACRKISLWDFPAPCFHSTSDWFSWDEQMTQRFARLPQTRGRAAPCLSLTCSPTVITGSVALRALLSSLCVPDRHALQYMSQTRQSPPQVPLSSACIVGKSVMLDRGRIQVIIMQLSSNPRFVAVLENLAQGFKYHARVFHLCA